MTGPQDERRRDYPDIAFRLEQIEERQNRQDRRVRRIEKTMIAGLKHLDMQIVLLALLGLCGIPITFFGRDGKDYVLQWAAAAGIDGKMAAAVITGILVSVGGSIGAKIINRRRKNGWEFRDEG